MRPLSTMICAAATAICLAAPAHALVFDVTELSCADAAAELKVNQGALNSVLYVVMWSHGYAVATEHLPTGINYKRVESLLRELSDGKCRDSKSNLFSVVKKMVEEKVSEDDAYTITELTCEDMVKETKDASGKVDQSGMIGDLAWLHGYSAGQTQSPPKVDFTLLGAAAKLTIDKCKTEPVQNVATVLKAMIPIAPTLIEQAEAVKRAAAAPAPSQRAATTDRDKNLNKVEATQPDQQATNASSSGGTPFDLECRGWRGIVVIHVDLSNGMIGFEKDGKTVTLRDRRVVEVHRNGPTRKQTETISFNDKLIEVSRTDIEPHLTMELDPQTNPPAVRKTMVYGNELIARLDRRTGVIVYAELMRKTGYDFDTFEQFQYSCSKLEGRRF